jgi:hypothetical protein
VARNQHSGRLSGNRAAGVQAAAMLLSAHGICPKTVKFVTDPDGFPAMPGTPQQEAWSAVFLAEPYITAAGQQYGQQVLADLDQGAVMSLPVDGYVATQAWARAHPGTAAAFTRAIEQGQAIANGDASTVQAIMARDDQLPAEVTASMALPRYPVGAGRRGGDPAGRPGHEPGRPARPGRRHRSRTANPGRGDDQPRFLTSAARDRGTASRPGALPRKYRDCHRIRVYQDRAAPL